jgi:Putative cell wall-binding domain
MKKRYKAIAVPILALSLLAQTSLASAESTTLKSIQGESPLKIAIAVAQELKSQSNTYVIATTTDYPDALAGTVLASKYNAPILFSSLFDDQELLDYLATKNVNQSTKFYILGGIAVVSPVVEASLKKISPNVVRLGGWTRYDTANLINDYLNVKEGTPVIIATGRLYPDALSVGAIGGQLQYPIYLVDENKVSQSAVEQLQRIKPSTVYIAGGTAVVPTNIENQIKTLLTSANIVRLAGFDRYETSKKIDDYFSPYIKERIYTTGEDFHSALVSAPLAAQHQASILLADNITSAQQTAMNQDSGYIVGSINVIPDSQTATTLSEEDIQRLQSYPVDSDGEMYRSFEDMYTNDRKDCNLITDYLNNLKFTMYENAQWNSSPSLIYYSPANQYCVRGIMQARYSGTNSLNLTPNITYQRDMEFRINYTIGHGVINKKITIVYLSDFRPISQ